MRNARDGHRPDIVAAAQTVIRAGAAGITVHPRPDQRHIRPQDVYALAHLLKTHPDIEFNIEGNPDSGPRDNGYPGFAALIQATRPAQATLVPDGDDQLTSDHGWDLSTFNHSLAAHIEQMHAWGARVVLFMDPDPLQIEQAKAHGADRIELYTGPFADTVLAHGVAATASIAALQTYLDATRYAGQIGLGVNAGHDLDLVNLPLFHQIQEIAEVSIGHALIADALEAGLFETVRSYLNILAT